MKRYRGLLIVSILLITVGLVGILSLGLFSGSCCNKFSDRRFSQVMSNDIDSHFIEQMIPHHEDAIEMSEMALAKAEHDEIKQLAEKIIESQSKEIIDMKGWYKSWYGNEVPESSIGNMGMMNDVTDLKSLEDAEVFDKEFIEQMIPHHEMAVMMATMLINRTNREEMINLAQDIIKTQNEEINQMNAWYAEWY